MVYPCFTRLRRKPWPPCLGGMRVSSEALAKEDRGFGGLRRTAGATGSCPWGSTCVRVLSKMGSFELTRDKNYLTIIIGNCNL